MTSADSVDRARKLRSAGGLAESLPAIPPGRTREDLERSPARRESALPTPAVEIGAPRSDQLLTVTVWLLNDSSVVKMFSTMSVNVHCDSTE